jgi:gluconate 5-dehydrogenase
MHQYPIYRPKVSVNSVNYFLIAQNFAIFSMFANLQERNQFANHMKYFDVNEKVVLITGSSRGLGNTLARGFASAGSRVVLNGMDPERVDSAVNSLKEVCSTVYGYPFDVSDFDLVKNIIPQIEEEVGPIDILVNNAGIHRRAPLSEMTIEDWNQVIQVNLNAVFFMSQQVANRMIHRGKGKIINISSLNAAGARPSIANYCSSKGGLNALTRSMATEWGPHNIQTNGIGPGYFKTDLTRVLAENPEFDAWVKQEVPLQRWGDPEELIGTAIYLASQASDYVNGFTIYVDGGWRASL